MAEDTGDTASVNDPTGKCPLLSDLFYGRLERITFFSRLGSTLPHL